MTDPIADMLTRLRNAVLAKHSRVDVPASKLKVEIAKILEDEGYIQGFKVVDEKPEAGLKVKLTRPAMAITKLITTSVWLTRKWICLKKRSKSFKSPLA